MFFNSNGSPANGSPFRWAMDLLRQSHLLSGLTIETLSCGDESGVREWISRNKSEVLTNHGFAKPAPLSTCRRQSYNDSNI